MCLLLLVIFVAILAFVIVIDEWELALIPVIALAVDIVAMIVFTSQVLETRVMDEKIAMYTEENARIEASIGEVVSNYMEFESDTYAELKPDGAITLLSLYPELKSDELVKAQIEVYIENNAKIKDLKESALDITIAKWWLYFGS